jgi:hypothetical protein
MRTSPTIEREPFSVLLFRRDAGELLLETTSHGFRLPVVSIPKHTRVAEQLTKAIKDHWNFDTVCLFPVNNGGSLDACVPSYAVEVWKEAGPAPPLMQWLPLTSLSPVDFSHPGDFAVLQASLIEFEEFRQGKRVGAFGKPGWLRTAIEWVEPIASGARLTLTGNFRQLNASSTFSLLRLETDGPALWFKAVGEPNVREFSITRSLTKLFPAFVPHVLGWHSDWNAWLDVEAEGMHLSETSPSEDWTLAAATLANLQLASSGSGLHLIEAGCEDIRSCSLLPLVNPFFECVADLMELQVNPTPSPLSRPEIVRLANEVRCCLEELNTAEIPSALGHLDFNPGNILIAANRCTFLDWAEGSVGHPFATFQYLLEHWRRFHGTDSDSERELVSSYAAPWRTFASPGDIDKFFAFMPLFAVFAYAVSSPGWDGTEIQHRPVMAGYLRSLTRRMKREADALRERRVACVQ